MRTSFLLVTLLTTSIAAIALPTTANATIVDNGTFLTDTVSNLDWYDVSATAGRSFTSVFDSIGTSGDPLVGWRYASSAEVDTLLFDFTGVPTATIDQTTYGIGDLAPLVFMLGVTDHPLPYITNGLTSEADPITGTSHPIATIVYDHHPDTYSPALYNPAALRWYQADSASDIRVGSFLVRAVPEPETYAMMLAGLGLIGFVAHRRKNERV